MCLHCVTKLVLQLFHPLRKATKHTLLTHLHNLILPGKYHENAEHKISGGRRRVSMTDDASAQGHGIIRKRVNDVDLKSVSLDRIEIM